MAYIQFLGAAGTVTGSKHLINTGDPTGKSGFQVLVDCGLFQGQKDWRSHNWRDTPVPAKEIDAVILTHAHLDHCGWIPRLVKEGFRGPIYATAPTIDLCGIILPDSGHLQEEDARFYNQTKKSKHHPALPLYTFDEAQAALAYFRPVSVGETVVLLKHLMEAGEIPRLPVFCDSPMAIKAVEIFLKHDEEYSDETRDMIRKYGSPLAWPGFSFASTSEESKKINSVLTPSVIISSSGMVTGGRILHHLAQRLPDPKNLVLFIGFQAPGTRGFTIKSKAPEVKIFGDFVAIRAHIAALEQFSDHADPPELLQWLRTFGNQPGKTYLVHGEPDASGKLRDLMTKELGWDVRVAEYLEKVQV